jgi:hypothetical protein
MTEPIRLPKLEPNMTEWGRDNYHVETFLDSKVPCWCEIDRDHTMREFLELP